MTSASRTEFRHVTDVVGLEGQLFAGRFLIEAQAGAGGMGIVYRAFDRSSGELVALKVLHKADSATLDRLRTEARALETLEHEGIVRYIAHGVGDEGAPYLAMEWVPGESLHLRLRRGPLAVADVAILGCRLANALETAHARGIVHCDIKPGNVLLPSKRLEQAMLADFGLARTRSRGVPNIASTRAVVGTPGYMAPEQARGAPALDGRSDLFSLGCLLFRCLTGVEAFEETSELTAIARTVLLESPRISEFRSDIPPALERLVTRLLARDLDERPPSAKVVRAELERIVRECGASEGEIASGEVRTLESAVDVTFGRYVLDDCPTEAANVVRARDSLLGRSVTLQVFGSVRDTEAIARLLTRARAAAGLSHPNIAAIYDVGEHAGVPFVATECPAGGRLRDHVGDPSVGYAQKIRWLSAMARGLATAHRAGVTHGALNPDNVVVGDGVNAENVKVIDFGFVGSGRESPYTAPEQRGGGAPDAAADQFAWGMVAFELLTGHLGYLHGAAWQPLPDGISAIVRRALRRKPEDRFPSMDALLETLEAAPHDEPELGPVPKTLRARRPALLAISLAFALSAGAIMVLRAHHSMEAWSRTAGAERGMIAPPKVEAALAIRGTLALPENAVTLSEKRDIAGRTDGERAPHRIKKRAVISANDAPAGQLPAPASDDGMNLDTSSLYSESIEASQSLASQDVSLLTGH
ncbi:serine/threonine protein kinase [Pendulispora rubella]|uniref:Serine/threonine protein kinase n=1 Tax=Pendulispora rubella TaxID=2741070 RepID=A0ABZ2L643_9BACT